MQNMTMMILTTLIPKMMDKAMRQVDIVMQRIKVILLSIVIRRDHIKDILEIMTMTENIDITKGEIVVVVGEKEEEEEVEATEAEGEEIEEIRIGKIKETTETEKKETNEGRTIIIKMIILKVTLKTKVQETILVIAIEVAM